MAGKRVAVVQATADHIAQMVPHVRDADRREFWALARKTPTEVLERAIASSTSAWTGVIDGEPVCMFGVAPVSLLTRLGTPWLVSTYALETHQTTFLRRCKPHLAAMLREYDELVNVVDVRNHAAIAWLEWLGFDFGRTVELGPDRREFLIFRKEVRNV